MMNRKAGYIKAIEKVLNDEELMEAQRQTLVAFDRFNELESQCRLSTRLGYIKTVAQLGKYYRNVTKKLREKTYRHSSF